MSGGVLTPIRGPSPEGADARVLWQQLGNDAPDCSDTILGSGLTFPGKGQRGDGSSRAPRSVFGSQRNLHLAFETRRLLDGLLCAGCRRVTAYGAATIALKGVDDAIRMKGVMLAVQDNASDGLVDRFHADGTRRGTRTGHPCQQNRSRS